MIMMTVITRWSPNSGTASEVGGMISARRRKNTVRESRMEMHRVTLWWNLKKKMFDIGDIGDDYQYDRQSATR